MVLTWGAACPLLQLLSPSGITQSSLKGETAWSRQADTSESPGLENVIGNPGHHDPPSVAWVLSTAPQARGFLASADSLPSPGGRRSWSRPETQEFTKNGP